MFTWQVLAGSVFTSQYCAVNISEYQSDLSVTMILNYTFYIVKAGSRKSKPDFNQNKIWVLRTHSDSLYWPLVTLLFEFSIIKVKPPVQIIHFPLNIQSTGRIICSISVAVSFVVFRCMTFYNWSSKKRGQSITRTINPVVQHKTGCHVLQLLKSIFLFTCLGWPYK